MPVPGHNPGFSFNEVELAVLDQILAGLLRGADMRIIARHPAAQHLGEVIRQRLLECGGKPLPILECPRGCPFRGTSKEQIDAHTQAKHPLPPRSRVFGLGVPEG